MKLFFLKAKHFIKRNIYPITVSLCTALMIGIIAISAYTSIKASNDNRVIVRTNNEPIKNNDKQGEDNVEQPSNPSDDNKEASANDPIIFMLPFENASISKEYAEDKLLYDKTTKFWCTHQGIDFSCNEGKKVVSVFDGKITKIENSMMNGTTIYIQISENLIAIYKGLSAEISVKEGDTVKKGQELGKVTTMLSEKADGVHLHFELMKDDKLIDPTEYFSIGK